MSLARRGVWQFRCVMSSARASSPAVPCFGRGPRKVARSSAARPCRIECAASGCLSSASSGTGATAAERDLERKPREHAVRRIGQRQRRVNRHRHIPARQRAATRRPSATSCVTSAAVLPGISTASRKATAMASASSSALAASITAMRLHRRVGLRGERFCPPDVLSTAWLAAAGRKGFGDEALAAVRRRLCERPDVGAGDADARRERGERKLRMAVRGVAAVGKRCPGGLVEIGIEAGQHHRAVRQFGDGCEQRRGRRDRAGGAGGDHRARVCWQSRRLGFDQSVAALGRLDAALFVEECRPILARRI